MFREVVGRCFGGDAGDPGCDRMGIRRVRCLVVVVFPVRVHRESRLVVGGSANRCPLPARWESVGGSVASVLSGLVGENRRGIRSVIRSGHSLARLGDSLGNPVHSLARCPLIRSLGHSLIRNPLGVPAVEGFPDLRTGEPVY